MSLLWSLPTELTTLGVDEVHVWRASQDCSPAQLAKLQLTLAEDEQLRAARFHFLKDRNQYIVTRGVLRTLLGRYLGKDPVRLRFCYSPYGKPKLEDEFQEQRICFNVSHSGGLALLAFGRDRELGVDIEQIRPEFAGEDIAEHFFSASEVQQLRSLDKSVQDDTFFSCWARKEAYIKAIGEGHSMPLHRFDVSIKPAEPAALLRTRPDPREASKWSLRELHSGPGFAAAIAARGHGWVLKCWQWTG